MREALPPLALACSQRFVIFGGAASERVYVRRPAARNSDEWVRFRSAAATSGCFRIVRGAEDAFFDLPIAFGDFVAHFLRESFQFFDVGLHGVREIVRIRTATGRRRQGA